MARLGEQRVAYVWRSSRVRGRIVPVRSSATIGTVLLLALAWTILCGAIFSTARQLETPVRSAGFGHREAESLALAVLIGRDSQTYGDYIVINSARSRVGADAGRDRWVVLCNRSEGGARDTAIIVELDLAGSEILGFRRPGQTKLEPNLP